MLYNLTMTRRRRLLQVVVFASGLPFVACASSRNAAPAPVAVESMVGLSHQEREWLALGTPESQWVWVPGGLVTEASAELPPDSLESGLSSAANDVNTRLEQPTARTDCRTRADQCSDELNVDDSIFNVQVD